MGDWVAQEAHLVVVVSGSIAGSEIRLHKQDAAPRRCNSSRDPTFSTLGLPHLPSARLPHSVESSPNAIREFDGQSIGQSNDQSNDQSINLMLPLSPSVQYKFVRATTLSAPGTRTSLLVTYSDDLREQTFTRLTQTFLSALQKVRLLVRSEASSSESGSSCRPINP